MKKIFLWIQIIFVVSLVSSCKKALNDVNDYYPKIKTLSAEIQTDGSVLVKGEITSEGAASIDYIGFCCGTVNNPTMVSRQVMTTAQGIRFSAVFSDFSVDSVYYFRGWATNHYGYSYSNSVKLDSIIAKNVTAPCSLILNTVNIGGSTSTSTYDNVSTPSNYLGQWSFTGKTYSGPTVTFLFGSKISTGIYTTVDYSSPSIGEVYVSFHSGFTSAALNGGTSVYVNTIGSNIYDISICNAPWNNNSSSFNFNTRLKVPL